MATMQRSATVGVFNSRAEADRAVDELVRSGYSRDQIGVVAKDDRGNVTARSADEGEAGEQSRIRSLDGSASVVILCDSEPSGD